MQPAHPNRSRGVEAAQKTIKSFINKTWCESRSLPSAVFSLGESWQKRAHPLLPADAEALAGARKIFVNAFLLHSIFHL